MAYSFIHRSLDLSLLELLQQGSNASSQGKSKQFESVRTAGLSQTDWVFFSEQEVLMASEALHAAPLSPLKTRDLKVLDELFSHDEMRRMEEDILHNLLNRFPEPCWEDTLLEFL